MQECDIGDDIIHNFESIADSIGISQEYIYLFLVTVQF